MPSKVFEFRKKSDFTFDDTKIVFEPPFVRLNSSDSLGNALPRKLGGKFNDTSEITFLNWSPDALEELFGFEIDAFFELEDDREDATFGDALGSVGFQISNNNGISFLFFSTVSSTWSAAGVNDFSSTNAISEGMPTFPLTEGRQLQLKMRLTPDTLGRSTPVVQSVSIHHEVRYDFHVDIMRSVKRFMDANLRPNLEIRLQIPSPSDQLVMPTDFVVDSVLAAYNLSTDPDRLIDLFSSITITQTGTDKNGDPEFENRVFLTSTLVAGSIIEIQFRGIAPVFIVADEDERISVLPAYLLEIPSIDENKIYGRGARKIERNIPSGDARIREQPVQYDASVQISCLSSSQKVALSMVQEIHRQFDTFSKRIRSLAIDEDFESVEISPLVDADAVSTGLSNKQITMTITQRYHLSTAQTVKLAQTINTPIKSL